ncbi:MAG TPA: hypothetical protein GX693_06820 [Firmicutes bacterium]|nr:hypothetical protein [Bacillota bacterium]
MEQLELLWRLQDIDLAIVSLNEEIENNPLMENVRAAQKKLDQLQAVLERETERQTKQRKHLKSLEMDLNKIISDRTELHKKLYGGEVSNVRELELMGKRLVSLESEQESLEEKIIKLMEDAEGQQHELDELKEQAVQRKRDVQNEENKLRQKLAELNAQLKVLREKRGKILPRVESKYLDLYRIQCQRHQGKGISRVINDTCEGCRVFISSAQRGLLYNPSSIVYCENCGRLLIRLPEQDNETADT